MNLKEILEHHLIDHVWNWMSFGPLRLPISKHLLMMIIVALILIIFLPLIIRSSSQRFSGFKTIIEMIVLFLRDEVVIPNLGHDKGPRYLAYFCSLFFFILLCNLLGMIPFGATATGNIAVTGAMAFTTFVLINFAGIKEHGIVKYISHFIPEGVPRYIYPIIFPIEILGLVVKSCALCIRLFANMIAGHIVIFAFIGLIFIFGKINPLLGIGLTAPISIVMVLFVSLLELFVAFLQAYIFTFLTAIFVGASMHPH